MSTAISDTGLRAESYARRHRLLLEGLAAAGGEVLIAYGAGAHSFIGTNPAWYASGFKQMGPHAAAVLPVAGAPFLVVTPKWDGPRGRDRSAIAEVIACEPENFLTVLRGALQKRGLLGKRFGVAGGEQQTRAMVEAWPVLLGQTPIDAEHLVSDVARIRDAWSMACTRKAVAIAEDSYDWLLETARPGMWEHEVAGALEAHIRELGAEDNFQLMSASQHNRSVHMPTRRLLAKGDILLGEITPAVEGEFVQICRTAVFGTPSTLLKEKFALLDEALRAGMKAATPGTPVLDVVHAINKPIAAAGYERYTKPPFMRTRGHSMALGSMDPEIATFSGHVLAEGVVFVMHPNQYIPETGYLMCGEPVIITDAGAEVLTRKMGELHAIN
jgi:Xaa-Pro dipeptidase